MGKEMAVLPNAIINITAYQQSLAPTPTVSVRHCWTLSVFASVQYFRWSAFFTSYKMMAQIE